MAKIKEMAKVDFADGEELPQHLVTAQVRAMEPAPKAVPLVRQKKDPDGPDPGPPLPPKAKAVPVPRTIHQNERAPSGLIRYKIRCTNYGGQPTRYILASSEDQAREHYLHSIGLATLMTLIADPPTPLLFVRALSD